MYEVETKFLAKNNDILNRFSNWKEKTQIDYIFVDNSIENFDIPKGGNILRIREENKKTFITLKKCGNLLELETEIQDGEVCKNIFEQMGIKML